MMVRSGRASFLRGLVAGIVLVFALSLLINRTTFADWAIAPLLLNDTGGTADVMVVLGAGIIGDCVPNLNAVRRVLLASRLWHERRAPILLFTGGTGGSCPVAVAMARMARELGVPAANVRVETFSSSTWENAEFSEPLLRGWGMQRVLLVTDRLHMPRATGAFARRGFEVLRAAVPISEGHENNVSMLRAGVREYLALAYYRLRGWTGAQDGTVTQTASRPAPQRKPFVNDGPIVVLGASYAKGWPLERVGGVPVVNRGHEGEESSAFLQRFERDVVALSPRAVILWGFINDVHNAPGGQVEAVAPRVTSNIGQMIALARQHGIEPILATEVTIRPPAGSLLNIVAEWVGALRGKTSYQDRINQQVLTINRSLAEMAARENLLLLQLQPVVSDSGGRRRTVFAQPDGSHITAAGYEALTTYATPLLEEFFVAR